MVEDVVDVELVVDVPTPPHGLGKGAVFSWPCSILLLPKIKLLISYTIGFNIFYSSTICKTLIKDCPYML